LRETPRILAERELSWIDCTAEYRTGADPPRCFQRQRSSPDKGIADNVGPSADDIDCGTGRSSLACKGIDFCSRATELEIFDQAATGTARRATRRTGRDGRWLRRKLMRACIAVMTAGMRTGVKTIKKITAGNRKDIV
jgi:hypothetical protein